MRMHPFRQLLAMIARAARGFVALAALAAIAAGFWMAWPPLGLIVPGAIVFGSLALSHVRGDR